MRKIGRAWLVFLCLFGCRALAIEAGAYSEEYTPEVDKLKVSLGGYSARGGKPATSVHDPVRAEALVLRSGQAMAAIVTMDIGGVSKKFRDDVLKKLQGTGIIDSNFLISATHTHSAPGSFKDETYYQYTLGQVANAIKQAIARLEPATLRVGEKSVPGLTLNRRDPSYDYGTRRFQPSYDPQNPLNITDDRVTVLRVDNASGKTIALLVNFATHATVLGSDSFRVSADWPGAMKSRLEKEYPGATAMFMNGAQGDQAPASPEEKDDLKCVEIVGNRIAEAAMSALAEAKPVNAEPLKSMIEWPRVNAVIHLYKVPIPRSLLGKNYRRMPLMAVSAGEVVIMAIPLEAVSKIGLAMKSSAHGFGYNYPLVAGLANAHFGYCATPDEFKRGGYEVALTGFGEIESGFVIGQMMLMLEKLKP